MVFRRAKPPLRISPRLEPTAGERFRFGVRRLRDLSAAQLFVGSFILLIALGTLALKLLPGLYTGEELDWLDALFTSTSAVCVTGLIVKDTATYFTTAGQAVILVLIQLGGLGIVAFTSLIIVAIGRRLSLNVEQLSSGAEIAPHVNAKRLLRGVFVYTFGLELIGFLLLWGLWARSFGVGPAAWHAAFHSVSAFCNAGFSTFTDSLVGFNRSPLTLGIISTLIIFGGIGFLVLEDVRLSIRQARRGRHFRLSLHSILTIGATLVLIVGGWVVLTWFEWTGELGDMAIGHRLSNGLFMSVTARTAGFNSINYANAGSGTNFLTVLLMTIGGAPGSTAGGIKVTSFALITLLAWNRMRGRRLVTVAHRSISEETIERAIGLTVVAVVVMFTGLLILTRTEPFANLDQQFLDYLFEVVSAFNTVGLSMGPTASLSPMGRMVIIVLMFLGRVGPLMFAAAIARSLRQRDQFRYAYEGVVVG